MCVCVFFLLISHCLHICFLDRNSAIPPHAEEPQFLGGKTNASGYLLSHDDSGSSGFGSQPGNHNISPLNMKSEGGIHELVSPRISMDNHGPSVQSGHTFRSNWPVLSSMERPNVIQNVEEKGDHGENNMATNLSLQGKKCANIIIHSSIPISLSSHVDAECMENASHAPGGLHHVVQLAQDHAHSSPLIRRVPNLCYYIRDLVLSKLLNNLFDVFGFDKIFLVSNFTSLSSL